MRTDVPRDPAAALRCAFGTIEAQIRAHAARDARHPALVQDSARLDYGELDAAMDRVAAALQRDGVHTRDTIAICAANSIDYAVVFLGALRAGVTVAPLSPSLTADAIASMLNDCGAELLFADAEAASLLATHAGETSVRCIGIADHARPLADWLPATGVRPAPIAVEPDDAFNIIYSSGTTGEPKGIVQPHAMRWAHMQRGPVYGYAPDALTLLSTPLYSNTTLVSFFPALAMGGTVALMAKFDPVAYLQCAQDLRVTHTMLVPVQYRRLLDVPDFDRYDLASFRMKLSTSAPFAAELKAEVLARWPGELVEFYGMTEGGGTCVLRTSEHRDKLHTVGVPGPGHDIRLVDDSGREVAPGGAGEVVGHSAAMMTGYHRRPEQTAEATWFDATGKRFIRSGDIGRFDDDGFLVLLDRKKDVIISGGFNIYAADLEAVLRAHASVAEAAVVGVASTRWGETPVAFVVMREPDVDASALLEWANARVGRMQRIHEVVSVDALPRSPIGKVLKRELRDRYAASRAAR
ncbi:MAG TPA: class I adenylate-forming enzyme family protein [Casimicrobiaceae bacterium]